jgi:hypothetical protein
MAVAEEARTLAKQTSADQVESIRVDESMTMVAYSVATTVGASAALGTALVLASTSSPSPSLVGRCADDQHLANEVV